MYRLFNALELPQNYICSQMTNATGMEALMILLRRLVYPNRWCDLVELFGRSESELSLIFNESVQAPNGLIANLFGPIEGKRHDAFMLGVSGLANKLRQFQRPNGQPYIIYGDPAYGLTRNILAPYRGQVRRHDAFMLGESGITNKLIRFQQQNGEPDVIYGDPAYRLTRNILAPYRGAHLTNDQAQFNSRMSKVRSSVECEEDNSKLCLLGF
ncbi:hypothetical protein AC249_AIPGENE27169 [Exaiptasia diaphana]|nr:hypothetical protein AC249_AIPGENE27169 [Exaiptasia diaphana]